MSATQPLPIDDDETVFDYHDDAQEAAADARAEADAAAGRVISHEAMARWLRSWGTPDELPPPQCGE